MIDMKRVMKLLDIRNCCRNASEKVQQVFVIIKRKRMESYLLKAQLQMQSKGA